MFYFWREATAALVPGFLCQSGRRRPENVSILSSLLANEDGVEKAQCALTIETFSFKDDNDYEYDIWLQVFSRILKL